MLKIYNSLTQKKEDFIPIRAGLATMYSCGPTVYDHAHIGNLRAYLFADLVQRTLQHIEDLKVEWVMNITDVDDKMIVRVLIDFPNDDPLIGLGKLADKFTDAFVDDLELIGIQRHDIAKLPRATDHIHEMQALIAKLSSVGLAYISDGSVYFSLTKYEAGGHKYGVLTNVDFEGQSRVIDDQDQKEGAGDFVLWKGAKDGEPEWPLTLGGIQLPGRPGWHVECSAMSTKYLGQPFDIHTGGVDLKFPHHTNEIAQSVGCENVELAHYFMHNEFLNLSGEKMAKSVGNFFKLSDIKDAMAFRLMCMQSHYRTKMDFSMENLAAARTRLDNLREFIRKNQYAADLRGDSQLIDAFRREFTAAMRDDLNSPGAFAALAKLERSGLRTSGVVEAIAWADRVLGLGLIDEVSHFTDDELAMQAERALCRAKNDYVKSDELRAMLMTQGIESEDLGEKSEYWRIIH